MHLKMDTLCCAWLIFFLICAVEDGIFIGGGAYYFYEGLLLEFMAYRDGQVYFKI